MLDQCQCNSNWDWLLTFNFKFQNLLCNVMKEDTQFTALRGHSSTHRRQGMSLTFHSFKVHILCSLKGNVGFHT